MNSRWLERLRKHYSLIKMLPMPSKPRRFTIESARGNDAVEFRGVMDRYPGSDYDNSNLRITYSKIYGWVSIFKIGVIYSVIRLGTDRKALLARYKATKKNKSRVDNYIGMDIPFEELEITEEEDDISEEEDVFSDLSVDENDNADEEEEEEEKDEDTSLSGFVVVIRRKRRYVPTNA